MADEPTRRLLQRAAGTPPTRTPLGEIEHRATRLRRRRRVAANSIATALVLVTVIGAVSLIAQAQRHPSTVAFGGEPESPTTGRQTPTTDGCIEPAYTPGYLPWVQEGQEPLAPDERRMSSRTVLRWSGDDGKGTSTVTLRRRDGTVGGKDGREVPAMLGGMMGRLSTAADGREVRVVWSLGGGRCNVLELTLTAYADMAGRHARREAIEIAQSLTGPDGRTLEPSKPEVCPASPVVPTYLPWLSSDETAPPGRVSTFAEQGDRYDLQWRPPGQPRDKMFYVSLSRYSDLAGYGGAQATRHVIMGVDGMLAMGTMPGDVAIGACPRTRRAPRRFCTPPVRK